MQKSPYSSSLLNWDGSQTGLGTKKLTASSTSNTTVVNGHNRPTQPIFVLNQTLLPGFPVKSSLVAQEDRPSHIHTAVEKRSIADSGQSSYSVSSSKSATHSTYTDIPAPLARDKRVTTVFDMEVDGSSEADTPLKASPARKNLSQTTPTSSTPEPLVFLSMSSGTDVSLAAGEPIADPGPSFKSPSTSIPQAGSKAFSHVEIPFYTTRPRLRKAAQLFPYKSVPQAYNTFLQRSINTPSHATVDFPKPRQKLKKQPRAISVSDDDAPSAGLHTVLNAAFQNNATASSAEPSSVILISHGPQKQSQHQQKPLPRKPVRTKKRPLLLTEDDDDEIVLIKRPRHHDSSSVGTFQESIHPHHLSQPSASASTSKSFTTPAPEKPERQARVKFAKTDKVADTTTLFVDARWDLQNEATREDLKPAYPALLANLRHLDFGKDGVSLGLTPSPVSRSWLSRVNLQDLPEDGDFVTMACAGWNGLDEVAQSVDGGQWPSKKIAKGSSKKDPKTKSLGKKDKQSLSKSTGSSGEHRMNSITPCGASETSSKDQLVAFTDETLESPLFTPRPSAPTTPTHEQPSVLPLKLSPLKGLKFSKKPASSPIPGAKTITSPGSYRIPTGPRRARTPTGPRRQRTPTEPRAFRDPQFHHSRRSISSSPVQSASLFKNLEYSRTFDQDIEYYPSTSDHGAATVPLSNGAVTSSFASASRSGLDTFLYPGDVGAVDPLHGEGADESPFFPPPSQSPHRESSFHASVSEDASTIPEFTSQPWSITEENGYSGTINPLLIFGPPLAIPSTSREDTFNTEGWHPHTPDSAGYNSEETDNGVRSAQPSHFESPSRPKRKITKSAKLLQSSQFSVDSDGEVIIHSGNAGIGNDDGIWMKPRGKRKLAALTSGFSSGPEPEENEGSTRGSVLNLSDSDNDQYEKWDGKGKGKAKAKLKSLAPPSVSVKSVVTTVGQSKPSVRRITKSWPTQGTSVNCHICRRSTNRQHVRCLKCSLNFCIACMTLRLEHLPFLYGAKDFLCPKCTKECNCTSCCTKKGIPYVPTAQFPGIAEKINAMKPNGPSLPTTHPRTKVVAKTLVDLSNIGPSSPPSQVLRYATVFAGLTAEPIGAAFQGAGDEEAFAEALIKGRPGAVLWIEKDANPPATKVRPTLRPIPRSAKSPSSRKAVVSLPSLSVPIQRQRRVFIGEVRPCWGLGKPATGYREPFGSRDYDMNKYSGWKPGRKLYVGNRKVFSYKGASSVHEVGDADADYDMDWDGPLSPLTPVTEHGSFDLPFQHPLDAIQTEVHLEESTTSGTGGGDDADSDLMNLTEGNLLGYDAIQMVIQKALLPVTAGTGQTQ